MRFFLIYIVLLSTVVSLIYGSCTYCKRVSRCVKEIKAIVEINGTVNGLIVFTQSKKGGPVTLNGIIAGLTPGNHGLHIHEKGNITGGCLSTGPHYNPNNNTHGGPTDVNRHRGDLGNIEANANGTAIVKLDDSEISLCGQYSIVNRGIVVHAMRDDLGKGGFPDSLTTGNAGARLGCGVIKYL